VQTAYQPYVDNAMSRADLNYIFADMLGDIAQYVYVQGGDRPEVKHVSGRLLGRRLPDRSQSLSILAGLSW